MNYPCGLSSVSRDNPWSESYCQVSGVRRVLPRRQAKHIISSAAPVAPFVHFGHDARAGKLFGRRTNRLSTSQGEERRVSTLRFLPGTLGGGSYPNLRGETNWQETI